MREIKFRAWDGEQIRQVEMLVCYDKPLHGISVEDERPALGEVFFKDEKTSEFYPTDVEIMQYTGLRDKNGKEIFEDDIVKCGYRLGIGRLLKKVQGRVHYVGSCVCFCIQIPDGDDGFVSWDFGQYSDLEIIGNIYENPELIDAQNA